MPKPVSFTQDDVNVLIAVDLGFVIDLGVYDGPITREAIAEHVERLIGDASGVSDFITRTKIMSVELDDGTQLAATEEG